MKRERANIPLSLFTLIRNNNMSIRISIKVRIKSKFFALSLHWKWLTQKHTVSYLFYCVYFFIRIKTKNIVDHFHESQFSVFLWWRWCCLCACVCPPVSDNVIFALNYDFLTFKWNWVCEIRWTKSTNPETVFFVSFLFNFILFLSPTNFVCVYVRVYESQIFIYSFLREE